MSDGPRIKPQLHASVFFQRLRIADGLIVHREVSCLSSFRRWKRQFVRIPPFQDAEVFTGPLTSRRGKVVYDPYLNAEPISIP